MAQLTKEELIALDKRLDATISKQVLMGFYRDSALIHLLRYFEDYVRMYAIARGGEDLNVYLSRVKTGQDGLHYALKWIHSYCPSPGRIPQLDFMMAPYLEAGRLHESAMRYSGVWDLMAMLYRGRYEGEISQGIIHVSYANKYGEDFDAVSYFVDSPDSPDLPNRMSLLTEALDPAEIVGRIETRVTGSGRLKYFVPDEVFEEILDLQRGILVHLWELDPAWDVGGYTLGQFRDFWTALLTWCWIHHWVCIHSGIKGGALEDVVKMRQPRAWEEELSRRSRLDVETASRIVSDLTYDYSLYGPGRNEPDVTSQPFFRVRPMTLALSNQLVLLSNAERNLWKLISIKRPEIHSELRNRKERLWLDDLVPRRIAYGLLTFGPIEFVHGERRSDLDLLLIDQAAKFAVGCQLKWLTHPDRIKEVVHTDNDLLKGLDQARLSLAWLESRPARLNEVTGIADLGDYEFRALVLSKNTIGSAWAQDPQIPILSERLVHWILGEPHHRNLRSLWTVATERSYLPKRGKHYIDGDMEHEFGGFRFLGKNTGLSKISSWDPSKDIDFSGG